MRRHVGWRARKGCHTVLKTSHDPINEHSTATMTLNLPIGHLMPPFISSHSHICSNFLSHSTLSVLCVKLLYFTPLLHCSPFSRVLARLPHATSKSAILVCLVCLLSPYCEFHTFCSPY